MIDMQVFFRKHVFALILLVVVSFVAVESISRKTTTYDENYHLRYGKQILTGDSDRFDDSKMPVSTLNALFQKIVQENTSIVEVRPWLGLRMARIPSIAIWALLGFLIYAWGYQLYGIAAARWAVLLYVLEPNLLAHSRWITTDIFLAAGTTLALYTFWWFLKKPGWDRAVLSAIGLGLCQLAKYTGVFLYVVFLLIIIVRYLPEFVQRIRAKEWGRTGVSLGKFLAYTLLFLLVSLLLINAGFLFNRSFTPLQEYSFRSDMFQSIQDTFSGWRWIPVPVPYPYLEGLDWIVYNENTGASFGKLYLLGEIHYQEGFPGYFFIAQLLKLPLTLLALLLLAGILYLRKFNWEHFRSHEIFILVPIIFFQIFFNYFYDTNLGIRFIMLVFPLMILFTSSLFRKWATFPIAAKVVSLLAVGYMAISVFSYYPHFLAYFNEIVWDRKTGYHYLADSNLDWGQDDKFLEDYLRAHPEAVFRPGRPTPGLIVVEVNYLVGVREQPEDFAWLRENFEPIDQVAYSYLVFDVSARELERLNLLD